METKVSDVLKEVDRVRKIIRVYKDGNLNADYFETIYDLLLGYEEELLNKKVAI